jgi:hypothetical protein
MTDKTLKNILLSTLKLKKNGNTILTSQYFRRYEKWRRIKTKASIIDTYEQNEQQLPY